MFESSSRYYALKQANHTAVDGHQVAYVRRRFLPEGDRMQPLTEVTITEGDRLDLIAVRTLGSSEQFWQICDANNAMNPTDLTAQPGRKLRVALPPLP